MHYCWVGELKGEPEDAVWDRKADVSDGIQKVNMLDTALLSLLFLDVTGVD
jgi:hypothetical protein